jgi:hypothetical protein
VEGRLPHGLQAGRQAGRQTGKRKWACRSDRWCRSDGLYTQWLRTVPAEWFRWEAGGAGLQQVSAVGVKWTEVNDGNTTVQRPDELSLQCACFHTPMAFSTGCANCNLPYYLPTACTQVPHTLEEWMARVLGASCRRVTRKSMGMSLAVGIL